MKTQLPIADLEHLVARATRAAHWISQTATIAAVTGASFWLLGHAGLILDRMLTNG